MDVEEPFAAFDFLGEKKRMGSRFSASLSASKVVALRFEGEVRAVGVRLMFDSLCYWEGKRREKYHFDDSSNS